MKSLKVIAGCLILPVVTATVFHTVEQQQHVEGVYLGSPTTRSPADAIVFIFLERLDGDEDGRVSLTDVHSLADRYFGRGPYAHYMDEVKGYIKAIAKIGDVDGDGYLGRGEIKRAATALVEEAGLVQVGQMVELSEVLRRYLNGSNPTFDFDYIIDGMDRNDDDVISFAEIQRLITSRRFRFRRRIFEAEFENADANDDRNLNREEARQWMIAINSQSVFTTKRLFVYSKTAHLAGSEVADQWAHIHV